MGGATVLCQKRWHRQLLPSLLMQLTHSCNVWAAPAQHWGHCYASRRANSASLSAALETDYLKRQLSCPPVHVRPIPEAPVTPVLATSESMTAVCRPGLKPGLPKVPFRASQWAQRHL